MGSDVAATEPAAVGPEGLFRPVKARRTAKAVGAVTDIKLRSLGPGRHSVGSGLLLVVEESGSRRWELRVTVKSTGQRRTLGLGGYPQLTLADARREAERLKGLARHGVDPVATRRKEKEGVPTFATAFEALYAIRSKGWTNGKHKDQWPNTMRDYVFPVVGTLPISEVTSAHVTDILAPIWHEKRETARRVKQRVRAVMQWAMSKGYVEGVVNPVDLVTTDTLGKQSRAIRNHPALPFGEVADFIRKLRAGQSEPVTKLAFELLILTAVRTTEVQGATWDEFDLDARMWTIPAWRMKMGREHVVPLSARAVEILKEAAQLGSVTPEGLVFRDAATGKALSENRFLNAREALGYAKDQCTPHGFRSSMKDWAAEETDFPGEVSEAALAHQVKSKVERAYRRGQLLAKRRELMDAWAQYVGEPPKASGGNVVSLGLRRGGTIA